jgi:hypothetical protein
MDGVSALNFFLDLSQWFEAPRFQAGCNAMLFMILLKMGVHLACLYFYFFYVALRTRWQTERVGMAGTVQYTTR